MNALVRIKPTTAVALPEAPAFDTSGFAIFTSIPRHRHGIVPMLGMVVVYATDLIGREGILEGALYVREGQRPYCGSWEHWLRLEVEAERERRLCGPQGLLRITREVVQAIRWPYDDAWSLRLASGHVDGPYKEWAFGLDLIGKVVGIYRPEPQS